MSLAGKICLVTGASRGIGKGIALQLGEAHATVYITGRTLKPTVHGTPGSLEETATEIERRGGRCIPIQCDHSKDEQVEQVFERISRENDGQLDILVNNVYAAVSFIANEMREQHSFWEQPLSTWDVVNNVGLRNHYRCTVLAAKMMVPRKQGLIVMISSVGGLRYFFNVAYGVGKAALDRMAADCALELRKHHVTCVSLWPNVVNTEEFSALVLAAPESMKSVIPIQAAFETEGAESIEFSGKCVVHLATDKNILKKTGRILVSSDLGEEYGFKDIDEKTPWHLRKLWVILQLNGYTRLARYIPGFIKLPLWTFTMAGSKF